MKRILQTVIYSLFFFLIVSCKKDEKSFKSTSTINVINAIIDGGPVKVSTEATTGFSYSNASELKYGTGNSFSSYTGNKTITVVSSTDTTKTVFRRSINLEPINTLYLAGQSSGVDTIFRVERNFPFIQSVATNPDYSIYIRFVNLSPNSGDLNINLVGMSSNEVSGLPYKGITDFKKYAALTTTSDYVFEVREASTNTVLSQISIPISSNRFKTISLIIYGLKGTTSGTNAFGIYRYSYN